jgi:hypothetical protein
MNISLSSAAYNGLNGFNTGGTSTLSMRINKTITTKVNFASAPTNFANSIIDINQNQLDFGFDGALEEYIEIVLDSAGDYTDWVTLTKYAYFSPEDTTNDWVIDKNNDINISLGDVIVCDGADDAGYQKIVMVRYKYL